MTVDQLQQVAQRAVEEHETLARELGHQEEEAAQIRERLDIAGLDSDVVQVSKDRTRLDLLEKASAKLRPRVEAAKVRAQAAQNAYDQANAELQRAEGWYARLANPQRSDSPIVLMLREYWGQIELTRQTIARLTGKAPAELAIAPPLPEVEQLV